MNPDALTIAEQLDAERKAGKVRSPLHGIPVLIKDNIGTADKMETTAGSLALVGAKPPRDAFIVARLREAGAVILGKTNLSEWAFARSENASNGWSARGGQTRNPYVLDRNPNGSSSGSAVAVSANLCVVAIGTETDGSIVNPASTCGVVGLKPTVGLISRSGIIPGALSQDTAGPMARTVKDAAILLTVLAATDPADSACTNHPADLTHDFAAALKPGALRGARLGFMPRRADLFPSLDREEKAIVAALRLAGADVAELSKLPSHGPLTEAEFRVFDYELKDGLNSWFAALGANVPVKSLADLIVFNEKHREQEMRFCGQELFLQAEAKGRLTEKAYIDALAKVRLLARTEGLDALFKAHRLDAIIALTCGPAFTTDPVYGNRRTGGSSQLAAVAGYPNIAVPATDLFGLPIGISFIGPAWSDAQLLSLAADFEAQTRARREPRFLPTIETPSAKP